MAYSPKQAAQTRFIYLGLSTHEDMYKTPSENKAIGGAPGPNNDSSEGKQVQVVNTRLNIPSCTSEFYHCSRCLIIIDHEALPRKAFGKQEM